MHHKKTAGSTQRSIKSIGIANIEGEILTGVWIHLLRCNIIKSFRRLVITLDNLWPKFSGKFADRVGFEQSKLAGPILLPHLQRVFLLVDADENRCYAVHVKAFH